MEKPLIDQTNFLLSDAAKSLTPLAASTLSLDESYERFKDIRWGWQQGRPYCPLCGYERIYEHSNRRTFKCAKCGHHFSVTTRTIFRARKLPYATILRALSVRLHEPINALRASHVLGINYRTSHRLSKIFRIFGNIQPKTRENRWPFLNQEKTPQTDLLIKVNNALPNGLPEQVRSDVAQDIILGVLSGEITESALAIDVQKYIRAHYKKMEWRFDTLSLNAPVPGSDGGSWDDILDSSWDRF